MNETFTKAFHKLSDDEQKAIINNYGDGNDSGGLREIVENGQSERLLREGLMKLFVLLRERPDGDVINLSSFEEKVLKNAVAVGNVDGDTYR